jgi:hypothetical protein
MTMLKQMTLFFGMIAAIAAIIIPPYIIPVVNERRWGLIWEDVPNTFGAMHISDHIDWLVLGLELAIIVAAVVGVTMFLAKRD